MAAIEVSLRAIGAFYVFAGIVGMRALVMDHLMDQMLAAITLKPIPANEHRRRWLLGGSVLAVGMGGMALIVLSLWSVPLFLFGAATQAFYLVWARTAFPVDGDTERKGRSQTVQAALLYGVATVLVCAAALAGWLHPWLDPWAALIPTAGLALLALVGRHFLWRGHAESFQPVNDNDPPERSIPPVHRVRLQPSWHGFPLLDADTGMGVTYDDYVPEDLGDRIYAWAHAFHAGDDHIVQEFWCQFPDAEAETAHRAEGHAIALALVGIFGAGNVEGPIYPADIRYGKADQSRP
ncbi:hypothetical protein [Devosia sp. Root635]|uniref:hypothetical protein n=1 Tax=Devosia sp. Root635 TaxID=1736575 RepID=UPI0006F4ACC2|nr:hypothetical protein [Devosia sp. Root635]KRA46193.1 hypothetical protein ASD80_18200 [Devosia sp. Root635]